MKLVTMDDVVKRLLSEVPDLRSLLLLKGNRVIGETGPGKDGTVEIGAESSARP